VSGLFENVVSQFEAISKPVSLFNLGGGKTPQPIITSAVFLVVAFEVSVN